MIDWTIPRLRDQVRGAEDSLARLWQRVRGLEKPLGIGAALALGAAILSRLGLNIFRCNGAQKAARRACGMNPDLLESLLADTLLIAGTLSLVEFAREMIDVTGTAAEPIQKFWRAG